MIRNPVVISCVCLQQLLISLRKLLQSISGKSTCYSASVSISKDTSRSQEQTGILFEMRFVNAPLT